MKTPARVTQRCARDDLTDDWDDAADQRAVRSGDFGVAKAVHLLRHKLIQKAVNDFPSEGDLDKKRESITGLTDPPFWKVKAERWRGAIYVDPDTEQAWLVAAGRRYEREAKDFYKKFMADVKSRGAEFFLPTKTDFALYKEEDSLRRLEARETRTKSLAVNLLARALESEEHVAHEDLVLDPTVEEPHVLARVELLVDLPRAGQPDPNSILVEVSEIDWAYNDILAWDEQVFLAALCPQEDRWATTQNEVRYHSLEVPTGEELEAMARGDMAGDRLGHFTPGDCAHTVHRARLTQCTVDGEPVQAVCGRWFVPRQDHETKPECHTCVTMVRALKIRVTSKTDSTDQG